MASEGISPQMVVTTSLVALVSGFLLGVYAIRGYVISPELKKEREGKWTDPVESEESDIDEDDTILDHAPNWTNGEEADRRQGLRASVSSGSGGSSGKPTSAPVPASASASAAGKLAAPKGNEECKLVLVVRTDLGMTKGIYIFLLSFQHLYTH
jgi:peptidyl-tRNA hydrolase, PTH2 family